MINWHTYFDSVASQYSQWRKFYTITDVIEPQQKFNSSPLFDFNLTVATVSSRGTNQPQQIIERLKVQEGLSNYAKDQVLLVGKPGSGKSTALILFLLEAIEKAKDDLNPIPVLIKLRNYESSVLNTIHQAILAYAPDLTDEEINKCLREGKLLLLMDGINELPSQEARRQLAQFRQRHLAIPMIFTTRDLGMGGDLGLTTKLEMQPLSELQIREFIYKYLPEKGDQMIQQLGVRLLDVGKTPLLLKMFCKVFVSNSESIPSNLALAFRKLIQDYNQKRQDAPISPLLQNWCSELLQQLAWEMTKGNSATEIQVTMPRQEALTVLREYLREKVDRPESDAQTCLDNLLRYHLLQNSSGDKIEFQHQLLQEYYTAERLLQMLPELSDKVLQWKYLNYVKWTEPLTLMVGLIEETAQAERVVKLALAIDLSLGIRLAGGVHLAWSEDMKDLLQEFNLPANERDTLSDAPSTLNAIQNTLQYYRPPFQLMQNLIFISYSHKDSVWLEKFLIHLKPAQQQGKINLWSDTNIETGKIWYDEIQQALSFTKVAVFLVSPSFLASPFINQHELPPLLEKAKTEKVKIVWVCLKACLYEYSRLFDYQCSHNPEQPLESLSEAEQNQIITQICQKILQSALEDNS